MICSKYQFFISCCITLLAIVLLPNNILSQKMEVVGDVYIGDFTPESPLPRLKIKLAPSPSSGLLVENKNGTAHTWIPYVDGSIYLTGDTTEGLAGKVILRSYDGDYNDIFSIEGDDRALVLHGLKDTPSGEHHRPLMVDQFGKIVAKRGPEFIAIHASAFTTTDPHYNLSNEGATILNPNSTSTLIAPLHLPNGVWVNDMKVVFFDESPITDIKCSIWRGFHDHPLISEMARAFTENEPGLIQEDPYALSDFLVNNDEYYYFIEVLPHNNGSWTPGQVGNRITIKSIKIQYEIP